LGVKVTLKWPNDVLADGKKLCGILSEAVAQGEQISCVIVGCGVNVEQQDVSSVGQPAVSLANLGVSVSRRAFLRSILAYFWQEYPLVEEKGFAVLRGAYLRRFDCIGKTLRIKNGTEDITGVATGISEKGTLLIDGNNGPEEILIGDVVL
jgi:BirA family biotin operon repressor/biotin-[acetyl-CoA-carboxylase] ligase